MRQNARRYKERWAHPREMGAPLLAAGQAPPSTSAPPHPPNPTAAARMRARGRWGDPPYSVGLGAPSAPHTPEIVTAHLGAMARGATRRGAGHAIARRLKTSRETSAH
jgi:hypothetical protein